MKDLFVFVCLLLVASIPSSASATLVTYADLIGASAGQVDFTSIGEDSVTDPTPLFGAPVRVGNRLLFFPTSFASSSANGSADTTSGTLTMTVEADQGYFLEDIIIREYGDYTLSGVGTAATSATINGLLTVTAISPFGIYTGSLSATPAPPYTLPGDSYSPFTAVVQIPLTGLEITKIVLNFNNNLQTTSEAGTTAFIQKKVIDGPAFEVELVVPEPTTICLLGLGVLGLLRKRRA